MMIANSLNLNGVTREVVQTNNGQEVSQRIQLSFGSNPAVRAVTKLTEEAGNTTVITESLGTPTRDFVRYNSIKTTQTKQNGDPLDFASVLGIWGGDTADTEQNVTNGELYNEAVLGVVPFGRLAQAQRDDLIKLIDDEEVYEVDFAKTERKLENRRPRYTYEVAVDPEKYVKLLKRFGEHAGLNHLGPLDPANYADADKLGFKFTVDVWSRQLVNVFYGSGERQENLSGYNAAKNVAIPADAISIDELQQRLQELQ